MSQAPSQQSDLDQETLAAIGLAITNWSALEHSLSLHIVRLLTNMSEMPAIVAAFIVTSGTDARVKMGLLKTLIRFRFPAHADEFDTLADKILAAHKNRRNTLAHQAWSSDGQPGRVKIWEINTVGKLRLAQRTITATEIRNWAADFIHLARALGAFMMALGLPPLELPEPEPMPDQ